MEDVYLKQSRLGINSEKVIDALRNDKYLKCLYNKLNKLYLSEVPAVIKISEDKVKVGYSEDFYALLDKINMLINFRTEQIVDRFKHLGLHYE